MIKIVAILAAVFLAAAFAIGNAPGLEGMFIGMSTGAFGAYTLYATILLLKDTAGRSRTGIALTLLAFFAKFPVLGLGAYLSYRLGMMALGCFIAGVLVVYCGLVWRAFRHGLYPH
jgi:hypothetical protein